MSKSYKITDENIDNIMVTAFEGGINYWCGQVKVLNDDYKSNCAATSLSKGSTLILIDAEDDFEDQHLTKEKIIKGIDLYIEENGTTSIVGSKTKEINDFNIDANVADTIVQLAVFGEAIFG